MAAAKAPRQEFAGFVAERCVDAQHIRLARELSKRMDPLVAGRQVDTRRQMRVVENHFHVEGCGAAGDGKPDSAKADDAECRALVTTDQRRLREIPAFGTMCRTVRRHKLDVPRVSASIRPMAWSATSVVP